MGGQVVGAAAPGEPDGGPLVVTDDGGVDVGELVYLRPPSADFSVARVARRVAEGGHGIPEAALRRRFVLSLDYLETVYKPLVDAWEVYASSDDGLELLDWGPK